MRLRGFAGKKSPVKYIEHGGDRSGSGRHRKFEISVSSSKGLHLPETFWNLLDKLKGKESRNDAFVRVVLEKKLLRRARRTFMEATPLGRECRAVLAGNERQLGRPVKYMAPSITRGLHLPNEFWSYIEKSGLSRSDAIVRFLNSDYAVARAKRFFQPAVIVPRRKKKSKRKKKRKKKKRKSYLFSR
jgi:hypothetical protein